MRFKKGDKVRVRKDLDGTKDYGGYSTVNLVDDKLIGQEVTIQYSNGQLGVYLIKEDYGDANWVDEMFEPIEDTLVTKTLERNNKPSVQEQLEENLLELLDKNELVNHPKHYNQGSMETIEKIELLLTKEEYIGFLKGNIIKYDDRMNHKKDAENDLQKSKWYARRLRKTYYGGTNPND